MTFTHPYSTSISLPWNTHATLRTPDQFQMFTAKGNQACVSALEFVLERPELVNLFGLNKALFDELKRTGSIHPARQELETGS